MRVATILGILLAVACFAPAADRWEGPFYVHLVEWNKDGRAVVFRVGPKDGAMDEQSRFVTVSAEPDVARGFADLLMAAMTADKPVRALVTDDRQHADGLYWKVVGTVQVLRAETSEAATPKR